MKKPRSPDEKHKATVYIPIAQHALITMICKRQGKTFTGWVVEKIEEEIKKGGEQAWKTTHQL